MKQLLKPSIYTFLWLIICTSLLNAQSGIISGKIIHISRGENEGHSVGVAIIEDKKERQFQNHWTHHLMIF